MSTNKNSLYVQSLVSFLNDTKPYHSKITEVIEEYRFSDELTVSMQERFSSSLKLKGAWPYSFFSGGPGGNLQVPFQQLVAPNTMHCEFTLDDQTPELPLVPFAFDPRSFDGPGAKDVFVKRAGAGGNGQPLLEGHDAFLSHGAFVFTIRQTLGSGTLGTFIREYTLADGPFPVSVTLDFTAPELLITGPAEQVSSTEISVSAPGWVRVFGVSPSPVYDARYSEFKDRDLIAHATATTQQLALDITNPSSAINQVGALLRELHEHLLAHPAGTATLAALHTVSATVPMPVLVDSATNRILFPNNPYVDDNVVSFMEVPAGAAISANTPYFVVNRTVNGFQLSMTAGGAPVSLLVSGDGRLSPTAGVLDLPRSYEALFIAAEAESVPAPGGYAGWVWDSSTSAYDPSYLNFVFEALSPSLYFNRWTDLSVRAPGNLSYDDLITPALSITNIVADSTATEYEEWTLTAISPTLLTVSGSFSGGISTVLVTPGGTNFSSPQLSFTVTLTGSLVPGDTFVLTPRAEVTIHRDADLETWSVIKVNPLAYSRPVFLSTRYGYIESSTGDRDYVTVLDPSFPSTVLIIQAVSSTQFVLSSTEEPTYTATVTVNTPFDDGRLAFIIRSGSAYQFQTGDTFYVRIENAPPEARDVNLLYGYDAGPYDSQNISYNVVSSALNDYLTTIGFSYDSRFVNYNLAALNLQVQSFAASREWRLRAVADLDRPLLMPSANASLLDTLQVRAATIAAVSLIGAQVIDGVALQTGDLVLVKNQADTTTNGVYQVNTAGIWQRLAGYPELTGPDLRVIRVTEGGTYSNTVWRRVQPQVDYTYEQTSDLVDMPNSTVASEGDRSSTDLDLLPDIQLWYAGAFALEYLDEGTNSWVTVDPAVPINTPYSNPSEGLSFTIVQPSKPFIAARVTSTTYTDVAATISQTSSVDSGDLVYFRVVNSPPTQVEPAGLSSLNIPRLIIHGDSFYPATDVRWTLTWTDAENYLLQGIYGENTPLANQTVFPAPLTVNTSVSSSIERPDLGIHWTVVSGAAGLGAGDSITLETYEHKPSYLVHGSASGWQPNATIGEWYWNGKIGFKIALPSAQVFQNGAVVIGPVQVTRLRPDTPSAVYTAVAINDGHWALLRDGLVVGEGTSTVSDKYITVQLPAALADERYTIKIRGDNHALSLGHDLVIVRTDAGRAPSSGDMVVVQKAEDDRIAIAIQTAAGDAALAQAALGRVNINPFIIDVNTGGPALETTSPETAVLTGWVPTITTFENADGPTAFSDDATAATVVAAYTGEVMGTVSSLSSTPWENVSFTWDASFAATYLPLNTDVTLVRFGSGTDEKMVTHMQEGINFLLSGGALDSSSLFAETVSLSAVDETSLLIRAEYQNDVSVTIEDGPFGGFLPGYDNLPYDLEDGVDGYYDAGRPLLGHFERAVQLTAAGALNPAEEEELSILLQLVNPYLVSGDITLTTFADFVAALDAADAVNNGPAVGFGVPSIGMGLSVNQRAEGDTSTSMTDAFTILVTDAGTTFDLLGFDFNGLDSDPGTGARIFTDPVFPAPGGGLPPGGTLYDDFESPLTIEAPAQTIEISFSSAPLVVPEVWAWRPEALAPERVPVIMQLNQRTIQFSIAPAAPTLKLILL